MPGKRFEANPTAAGNVPVYKANGVQSLVATVIAFFLCWHLGLTTPLEVYSLFGEMLAGMSLLAIVFCVFLLVKGHVAPTDEDSGSCGNVVYDFWWGMELYPKIGPLNLKQFTNCRFGMMAWAILPIIFACHQYQRDGFLADSVAVCVALMCIYNFKFSSGRLDTSTAWTSSTTARGTTSAGDASWGSRGVRIPRAVHRVGSTPG